jgi:phosphopantetheine--protein transferase-like protein
MEGSSREGLLGSIRRVRELLETRPDLHLGDLAFTVNTALGDGAERFAVVSGSSDDLARKLDHGLKSLSSPRCRRIRDRSGIYWFGERLLPGGKVAFVFPGEGCQYPGMLSGLCMEFPEARASFDTIDRVFSDHERGYLPSQFIFPREAGEEDRLWQMDGAVEAVFTANAAIHAVLTRLGIRPDMIVGHSTGDYSALMAGGCIRVEDEESLLRMMLDLNGLYRRLEKEGEIPEAVLVAVGSVEPGAARTLVERSRGTIHLAMDNCPHQFVLCGEAGALRPVLEQLQRDGALCEDLPFNRAYHTSLFEPVCRHLAAFYGRLSVRVPETTIYSGATAAPLPSDVESIRRISVDQWARPVRFTETIEAMYEAGARIFVEAGPRGNLTAFITDILRKRPHLAVPADLRQRAGIDQLLHLLAILSAQGLRLDLDHMYARRSPRKISLDHPDGGDEATPSSASRMTLATGWPEMRLKEETAARLRSKLDGGSPGAGTLPEPSLCGEMGENPRGLRERILSSHFETMERFLRVQEDVMRAALSGQASPERIPQSEAAPVVRIQDERDEVQADPTGDEADARAGASLEEVKEALLHLVSDRTGYPPEMIDLNLDLEADLGIDSIKRVEILGSFQQQTGFLEAGDMDQLSSRKTLQGVIDFVVERMRAGDAPTESPPGDSSDVAAAATEGDGLVPPLPREFPFITEVITHRPGEELIARVAINREETLFLKDHCLGREISKSDADLTGLPVLPLTMTMEILAEAASALAPNGFVVGMREIRGHRWVMMEGDLLELEVVARRRPEEAAGEIEVGLFERPGAIDSAARSPVAEGIILTADRYPDPPPAEPFPLHGERPSRWTADRLYRDGMFHGPAFRGVVSMDRWGEDGAEATLESLDPSGHFSGHSEPGYVTDPVLLDQPGQVVGLWTAEHLKRGYVVFPFRLESLHLYGPVRPPGERFGCRARIALDGETQVCSDLDVVTADGAVHARFTGWWDRRFDLPKPFARLLLAPGEVAVGVPWPATAGGIFPEDHYRGALVDAASVPEDFFTAHGGLWMQVLAQVILGRGERRQWASLKLPAPRRLEWILGRMAAKDAARRLLEERYGLALPPADVEIHNEEDGRPALKGAWSRKIPDPLSLSISHAGGLAVAVVGNGAVKSPRPGASHGIGIDVEKLGRTNSEFADVAFTPEERHLLSIFAEGEQEEWALRCWCAKEAVAKALGSGFLGNPRNLTARRIDGRTGSVEVAMSRQMAEAFPSLGESAIVARTWREEDRIFGASTCQRSGE